MALSSPNDGFQKLNVRFAMQVQLTGKLFGEGLPLFDALMERYLHPLPLPAFGRGLLHGHPLSQGSAVPMATRRNLNCSVALPA
jgi:hypothetical protein